jgi:hypothetical protein
MEILPDALRVDVLLPCVHWYLQIAAAPGSLEPQQLDFSEASQQLVFSSAPQHDSAAFFAAFAAKKCLKFSDSSNEPLEAGRSAL